VTPSREPILTFPSVTDLRGGHADRVALNDTVDVWSCSLDGDAVVLERCRDSLSEEEHARAARFVRHQDQIGFVLAHGGLRFVLAQYLEIEPAALRFGAGPTGKPALLDGQGGFHVLRFNLSHSHGRMLIAVALGRDVGIDLEQIHGKVEALKLAERFYTQAEFDSIETRPASDQACHFYRLWVAKEAFLKAQGAGISSLQQCEILASTFSSRVSVRQPGTSAMPCGWTVQWLNCGPDWQSAVCTFGNDWSVRVLDGMSA
jgi:4'-phosphopantetheinyl transferase